MNATYIQQANAQTARWTWCGLGAALFVFAFTKAAAAMGAVPATINGNAIAWPVPTLGMFAWIGVAMLGVVLFSAGLQFRGSVRP